MKVIFETNSIIQCCNHVIESFQNEQKCHRVDIPSFEKGRIMKRWLNENFNYKHETYVSKLKKETVSRQQIMWQQRTIFVYYSIWVATILMSSQEAYIDWYKNTSTFEQLEDLNMYSFNNFGSSNIMSDIDISIDFSGIYGNISYVVATVEDVMYDLGGHQSTLNYDIECYGNFLMIKDKYYLISTELTIDDVKLLLPAISAGILRNYWYGNGTETDFKKFDWNFLELDIICGYEQSIRDILIGNTYIQQQAINMVQEYIYQDWTVSRKKYYEMLRVVDRLVNDIRDSNVELTHRRMVDIMVADANANVFRQENYIAVPTVMHVVRMIQGKQDQICTKHEKLTKIPSCTIGKWGYVISMIEQAGYLYRFRMFDIHSETKCIRSELTTGNCTSTQTRFEHEHYLQKKEKYMNRYKHAKNKLSEINKIKKNSKRNKLDKQHEKVVCECGSEVAYDSLSKHKKTKKHIKFKNQSYEQTSALTS